MPFHGGLHDTDTALMELQQSCCCGEALQELPCTSREALVPGEDFVAVGNLWFDRFSSERRKRRSSLHPPSAGCRRLPPEASGFRTGKDPAPRRGKELSCQSPRAERTNPSLVFATNWKLGRVGFASRSHRLPPAAIPGRLLGWDLSVCPGFPVLCVLLALLQSQRGSSLCLGQGCEGGQVGG